MKTQIPKLSKKSANLLKCFDEAAQLHGYASGDYPSSEAAAEAETKYTGERLVLVCHIAQLERKIKQLKNR